MKIPGNTRRQRFAWRLRFLADRISPDTAPRHLTTLSVTLERGSGWVLRHDRRGIPLWYWTPDYDRGHTEADTPL